MSETKTALDQADELIKNLIAELRAQFKSEPEFREFLCREGMLRGDSNPNRTKILRILSGRQKIQAREILAMLLVLGYTIEVKNKDGQPFPGAEEFEEKYVYVEPHD